MNSKVETITKFLGALRVDSVNDVEYIGKYYSSAKCVCGQPIKRGYLFVNKHNGLKCVVGYNCLQHIFDYIYG